MKLRSVPVGLALAGSIVGCGGTPDRDGQAVATTTDASTGRVDESSAGAAEGHEVLDVGQGTGDDFDPDAGKGCDKVDFLFVVDNSGSMADEQQALIDSFGPFIAAIEQRLGDSHDFHVMVTDVDAWVFGECPAACNDAAACDAAGSCGVTDDCAFPCALRDVCEAGTFVCGQTQPESCEDVMGAGITFPRGVASSNVACEFATGTRYMDAGEPDLAAAFACAARVGTGSSADTEQPMDAMTSALAVTGPSGECNAGFLRDDAILVVTFITDENDDPTDSTGSPIGWHAAIADAKHGDDTAVVVLGLFGDNDQPDGICEPLSFDFSTGAEPAPRLREFVDGWGERGLVGSVCAPDYAPFFASTVDSIGKACDDFVPPQG
jgi:SAM-dependent methyltransferase